LALGERLNDKLQEAKMEMQYEVGNCTCMLRECGVLDASNNFNTLGFLTSQLDDFVFEDQWLKEELTNDIQKCHAVSEFNYAFTYRYRLIR
jgi:hypothetical protein